MDLSSWAWVEGAPGGLPVLEWMARPRAQSHGGRFHTRLTSRLSTHSPEATGAIDPRDPAASPLGCLSVSPFCGTHSRRSGHACCDLLPLSGEGGSFEPWGWTGFCGTGILIADEESAGRWESRGSGEPGRSGDPSPLHRWGVPWTSLAPCGASLQESAGADALLCKAALPAPAPPCATVPLSVCSVALHGGSPGGWASPGSPPSAGIAGSQGAGLPAPSFLCPSALLGLRAACGTFRGRVAPRLSPCSCCWSVGALWFSGGRAPLQSRRLQCCREVGPHDNHPKCQGRWGKAWSRGQEEVMGVCVRHTETLLSQRDWVLPSSDSDGLLPTSLRPAEGQGFLSPPPCRTCRTS